MAETRYLKNASVTVNGLTAKDLGAAQSSTGTYVETATENATYIKHSIYSRTAGGAETSIGADVASYTCSNNNTVTLKTATWACPQTSMNATDAVVVEWRFGLRYGGGPTLILRSTTPQLGASQLDATTWTFNDYSYLTSDYMTQRLYFGDTTWNTRITNFSYTAGATGTNLQLNIGDTWKVVAGAQINIGDTWKPVTSAKVNIGDTWKTIF